MRRERGVEEEEERHVNPILFCFPLCYPHVLYLLRNRQRRLHGLSKEFLCP